MVTEFPCLGFEILGMCSYNPEQPPNVYFDIGSGISALGFTLAIQQLIKPIYEFRLRAYGVQFWHLTLAIFIGFLAIVATALVPNLPVSRGYFLGYPIFWEFLGGFIISGVYGFTAYVILKPTRIKNFNLITFVKSAGVLLTEASDDDRVKFAHDLSHNIESLFKYAHALDLAERKAFDIEFDRLREVGAELSIRGRVPISPFYLFAQRRSLERASYACSLLRILADTKFCATLVRDCPWHTAQIVSIIGKKELYTNQADGFIQQLARQAIISDESIMAREIEYDGFGEAPLLSRSLFSNPFILKNYRPLCRLMYERRTTLSISYIARLNAASAMMLEAALEHHGYWGAEYMYDVEKAYENLSHKFGRKNERSSDDDFPEVEWHAGIRQPHKILTESFNELNKEKILLLFIKEKKIYRNDLVQIISNIIYESFSSISNSFEGYNGRFWTHAIGIFMEIYPFHDSEPDGMNPLQQQLAIKLLDNLKDNMIGLYPAISKILLAVIGPYENRHTVTHKTAYVILKNAVYKELQRLPELHASRPERIKDYLPENIVYDPSANTLIHTYSGGKTAVTNLTNLLIPEVDLLSEVNWGI